MHAVIAWWPNGCIVVKFLLVMTADDANDYNNTVMDF